MPYVSVMTMSKLMKYSNVSLVIGAAPDMKILHWSKPRPNLTFWKILLAKPQPKGTPPL